MEKEIYLFPLTSAWLLKKVTLPFHIFEERYRSMVLDAVKKGDFISVLTPESSGDYEQRICVAGHPHIYHVYPDGKMDILITGMEKFLLSKQLGSEPYFKYSGEMITEDLSVEIEEQRNLNFIKELLQDWSRQSIQNPVQREELLKLFDDPEALLNYAVLFLNYETDIRREIMESDSLKNKLKILFSALGPREINLGPFMPKLKF